MSRLSRRRFLKTALSSSAGLGFCPSLVPAVITSQRTRPRMPSGIQIGDVLSDRAVVWSRSDRPARLVVERSSRDDFRDAVRVPGPEALERTDFVARVDLAGLPANSSIFVRVTFEDVSGGRAVSEPIVGRFRTAPDRPRNIRFVWSADTAGQGFGINPDWGGMRTYDAMRRVEPDFFIHCGDTIYADSPIADVMRLDDGTIWKNVVTEETGKVAESLREFRGRFKYNLLDDNVRRFSAEVPQIWQWDDHEVVNNWSDSKDLADDPRYTEKSIHVLARRARQAFMEYAPIRQVSPDEADRIYRRIPYGPLLDVLMLDERTYRGANSYNRQERPGRDTAFMGPQQVAWLKRQLLESKAVWKIVSSDMPIGLVVPDGVDTQRREMFEAVANGDGPPLGRELEIADVLRFIKEQRIRNVVWITADVHYTAAHYYDPDKAVFRDFDPFWEFVSGPLNAGSFGPNRLDNTFGPQVVFQKVPPVQNAPPTAGFQFFGQVDIESKTGALTVTLKDVAGASLFAKALEPVRK